MSIFVGFCIAVLFPFGIWFVLNWWMDRRIKKLSALIDEKNKAIEKREFELLKWDQQLIEKDEFLARVEKQLHDIVTYKARLKVPLGVTVSEGDIRHRLVHDICTQIMDDNMHIVRQTEDSLENAVWFDLNIKVVDDGIRVVDDERR